MFKKFIKLINSNHWGQKAFFDLLVNLKRLKYLNPFSFITLTVKKLRPPLKLISRVTGGKKVYNTEYIPLKNSIHFAFKWLIDAAKTRDRKTIFGQNLSLELVDAFHKKGLAYKTKLDYNTALKDNFRRARTKAKKYRRRKKQKAFIKKPYLNNSRLKTNGLSKIAKRKKGGFLTIKKKLLPLFRERFLLNYLDNKHKQHQKITQDALKKTASNVVSTQLNVRKKNNQYTKAKTYFGLIVKQDTQTNLLGQSLLNVKSNQTQNELNTIKLYAEKRYLFWLQNKYIKKNKQLKKKQKTFYKFLANLATKLKQKLDANMQIKSLEQQIKTKTKRKPKINAKNEDQTKINLKDELKVKSKTKVKKNSTKNQRRISVPFFYKLLLFAKSKRFKQKIQHLVKKDLIQKAKYNKLISIERILSKYNLRENIKLISKQKAKIVRNLTLSQKNRLLKLRSVSKPKSLNTTISNKRLSKTYLQFSFYCEGLTALQKQLKLHGFASKNKKYQAKTTYYVPKVKKQPENLLERFKTKMKSWLEDKKQSTTERQQKLLTQKLNKFVQHKHLRSIVKYAFMTKNFHQRKKTRQIRHKNRFYSKRLSYWEKLNNKLNRDNVNDYANDIFKLRNKLHRLLQNKKINLWIYAAKIKQKMINSKSFNTIAWQNMQKLAKTTVNQKQRLRKKRKFKQKKNIVVPKNLRKRIQKDVSVFSRMQYRIRYLPVKKKQKKLKAKKNQINYARFHKLKRKAKTKLFSNIFDFASSNTIKLSRKLLRMQLELFYQITKYKKNTTHLDKLFLKLERQRKKKSTVGLRILERKYKQRKELLIDQEKTVQESLPKWFTKFGLKARKYNIFQSKTEYENKVKTVFNNVLQMNNKRKFTFKEIKYYNKNVLRPFKKKSYLKTKQKNYLKINRRVNKYFNAHCKIPKKLKGNLKPMHRKLESHIWRRITSKETSAFTQYFSKLYIKHNFCSSLQT